MINNYKYHYFYKITNQLNGHYYYGIHSTNDLNDGYMGSGKRLNYAYKKYGKENFTKDILKYFDNRVDLANYEKEFVSNNLIQSNECYNIVIGGEKYNPIGTYSVFDKELQIWTRLPKEIYNLNPSKFILSTRTNRITVKYKNDPNNKYFLIDSDEYYSNKDKYEVINHFKKNTIIVSKKGENKQFIINKEDFDPLIYNRSKTEFHKNEILVKDKDGNHFRIFNDDPRFISGELKTVYTGYRFTEEQKDKLKNKFKEIKHQQGEKNSQFGTKWIYKDNITKKIKKEELDYYLQNGWKLGMLSNRKK